MTTSLTADAIDDIPEVAARPARKSVAFRMAGVLVVGIPLLIYAMYQADERRLGAAPSILIEIAVWLGLLFMTMTRNPRGELRLADPFVLMLVMFMNFFILPAITWMHGADFDRLWGEAGRIRESDVTRIQYMHVLFMITLTFAYFTVAPKVFPTRLRQGVLSRAAPAVMWMMALGVAGTVVGVAQRLASGGGILQNETYGNAWFATQDQVGAARGIGGGGYIVWQLLSKFWYFPLMALGVANGILLARFMETRSRVKLVLVVLQVPALLLLGSGGRSAVFIPFIMSFAIADALAGPLRWRWLSILAVLGSIGFGFFGQYRVYQDRGVSEATEMATERYTESRSNEGISAEGSVMLVKENYGITWTDINQFQRGFSYFPEILLGILPMQIVPMKAGWMNTAAFLSRGLLGRQAEMGAGIAGAILVDGYMVFAELGVGILGLLLGFILALVVKALLSYNPAVSTGPPLWRLLLLLTFNGQIVQFIRSDPGTVLSIIFYYLVLPVGFFLLVLRQAPDSVWHEPIALEG